MAEDTVRWLDLSKHGVELLSVRFPDGQKRLVLRGATEFFEKGITTTLGFSKTPAGIYVKNDLRVALAEFRSVFPQVAVADLPRTKVIRVLQGASKPEPQRVNDELALREAKPLGTNYLGQEVFSGVMGRFIRSVTDGSMIREGEASSPAVFLRAKDEASLALCAKGLVEEMMHGRVMKKGDLEAFTRTVFDLAAIPKNDERTGRVNAAIELEMANRWIAEIATADRHAFGVAVRLHETQPARDRALRREATPLPIIASAARLISAAAPAAVGVLHAGSGVIATALAQTKVLAWETDKDFASDRSRVKAPNAVWGKIGMNAVPASISLAPVRAIEARTDSTSGLFINRLDHQSALHSLVARTDAGRSVIVMGGDSSAESQTGEITQSRDVLNWIYQNYEVEGLVEIGGALTRKQPSAWPYRMLVVGNKLPRPDVGRTAPAAAQVVNSFQELWHFTQTLSPDTAKAMVQAVPVAPAESNRAPAAPAPVAQQDQILNPSAETKETEENEYQAPYVPFSKIGEAEAMIPRNLVGPTNRALSRVAQAHGDVDTYVATSLGLKTPKELAELFSPEQIDGLSLAYSAMEQGRGMIIGDMTGLGKGRELSGIARWAFAHGKPVVFITEKANLFSDFWRDLTDTQTVDMCMPFIVNTGGSIIDGSNKKVVKALPKEKQDAIINDKEVLWNKDFNIVFATYSQFSRKPDVSAKAAWLPKICENAVVILDESHNAAGDSMVNENIERALEGAAFVAYSSATYSDKPENMGVYLRVFPKGMGAEELRETLEVGGEPLMEILTAALAEDGVFIRREHDMSKLKFDPVTDTGRLQRNEALADEMADVMVLMQQAGRETESLMNMAMSRDKDGATYTMPNFGSRRYLANRQFMLALKVDLAVDEAIKALENGEKPVLVLESTMESLIREAVLDEEMSDEQLLSGDVVADAEQTASKVTEREIDAITFRDVLAKLFDKGVTVGRRVDGKKKPERVHVLDLDIPEDAKKKMRELREQAMSIIARFDVLPASPLDEFREKIEAAGFTCGEISGRGVRLKNAGPGKQKVVSAGSQNRFEIVNAFNSGELDVVMLTRSGSTGISMQNAPKFKDRRRRRMLEAQIFNNVKERQQVYGRTNRKGQISPPTISTLSTGLPGEVRNLAMQKKKLRRLSANTTGNRESMVDSDDVVDNINAVGEMVAISYLESRPAIASRLGIDLVGLKDDAGDTFVVNALMSRTDMLRVAEQRQVIEEVTQEYIARLSELDAVGLNPFRMTEHDWNAKVVGRDVFEPAQSNESALDAAVFLSEIEYERNQKPVRSSELLRLQRASLATLGADPRVASVAGGRVEWAAVVKACLTAARANVVALQGEAIEGRFKSVKEALAHNKPNAAKTLETRYLAMRETLYKEIDLGGMLRFEHGGEKVAGVVVGMKMPPAGKEHLPGQYEVRMVSPGQSEPVSYSLNTLVTCEAKADRSLSKSVLHSLFDTAPEGRVKIRRLTLDGNLFRSSQYAVRHGIGHSVSYTDENGSRRTVILLNKDLDKEQVLALPLRISDLNTVRNWLKSDSKTPMVFSNHEPHERQDETLKLERLADGRFQINVPKAGMLSNMRKDKELADLVGKLTLRADRATAVVPHAKLTAVLERLAKAKMRFYAPAEARQYFNRVHKREMGKKPGMKQAA